MRRKKRERKQEKMIKRLCNEATNFRILRIDERDEAKGKKRHIREGILNGFACVDSEARVFLY